MSELSKESFEIFITKIEGLEQKVKSMTAKEIILAMVEGLKNPVVKVYMDSFGGREGNGICIGCAATNFICTVGEIDPELYISPISSENPYASTLQMILHEDPEMEEELGVEGSKLFVWYFEEAINALRLGEIEQYNSYAIAIGIAEIENYSGRYLEQIRDDNYTDAIVLKGYIELAEAQTN